jgi:hypothetical protein
MATKLTRMTHKTATQLHLVAQSCIICSSRSRRPVRKLLGTSSYFSLPHAWRKRIIKFVIGTCTKVVQCKFLYPSGIIKHWCQIWEDLAAYILKMEAARSFESFHSEDGGSKALRNFDILPQYYTVSQPSEDGGSKVLLHQHYTASQHRIPHLE